MSPGIDFKALKGGDMVKESKSSATVSIPRRDWKKAYTNLKKNYENLNDEYIASIKSNKDFSKTIDGLQAENDMLRQQESQSKQSIDLLTQQVEQYTFSYMRYNQIVSEVTLILNYLHVNFNKAQHEALDKKIGSHKISDIRQHVVNLMMSLYGGKGI